MLFCAPVSAYVDDDELSRDIASVSTLLMEDENDNNGEPERVVYMFASSDKDVPHHPEAIPMLAKPDVSEPFST
jgi:hypothetical protein